MNDVTFNKGEGGLARTAAVETQYSGLVFYSDDKPSGFDTNIKEITSLAAAEALGITSDNAVDLIKIIHYHLRCYFAVYTQRAATPKLYLNIADVPVSTYDFDELREVQDYADGKLRQIGLFVPAVITSAQLSAIQLILTALATAHKPCQALVNFDMHTITDWTAVAIIDLRALTNSNVLVSIAQDGGADGAALYDDATVSVGDIGSLLAWASVKNIHENIGWPKVFKASFSGEFDVPALSNGDLISEHEDLLSGLDAKGYVLLKKHVGMSGSYYNDSHMANLPTSDYAYLENNQVIDEAIRKIRTYVLPELNSPLTIDPTNGTLAEETVSFFESLASRGLEELKNNGNISGYSVFIDPAQDVLSTSNLTIEVVLVIKGVARNITVNIGFRSSIA